MYLFIATSQIIEFYFADDQTCGGPVDTTETHWSYQGIDPLIGKVGSYWNFKNKFDCQRP